MLVLGVVGLGLSACSSDDPDDAASSTESSESTAETSPTTEAEATTTTAAAEEAAVVDGELAVAAVDYAFEGLPESVPAGTRLRIDNQSDAEVHELVAFRLPDDETRPFDELVALEVDELTGLFAGPPSAVLVQAPGAEPIDALGDGTLSEAGRYLFVCSIPTGADPDEYLAAAAASQGGPITGVAGGPPHLAEGMVAGLRVEGAG